MALPILIAIGANLPGPFGSPRESCEAVIPELERRGVRVVGRSRWFESAPVPPSDQPWFVNGVVAVETDLGPADLLALLHGIERGFGRVRRALNEARAIDLDLIAYGSIVSQATEAPMLPHPRLQERAFVLLPLADIAPDWRHPRTNRPLADMINALPPGQAIRPLAGDGSEQPPGGSG
jgi:2-amino-4-hydroxy-6-hydroxymethyldihydropteridine diphosphokinase